MSTRILSRYLKKTLKTSARATQRLKAHTFRLAAYVHTPRSKALLILVTSVISRQQLVVWNFDYFFLEVLKALLMTSIELSYICGNVRRLLSILLTTWGFVVSSVYLTFICSILTIDVYEYQIKFFEDLHTLNITVPITESNMKNSKLNGVPNPKKRLHRYSRVD